MKIKIYSQDGTLKLTASPGSGGQCVKQLQGDSELTLSFDYFEYVALDVNDYMDFCGDRYWLLEQYRPKEVSTVQWKFDVHLYGIESLIKRYLVIEHTDGDANPVFTLTAPASQHMRMIVECLNNATGTTDWHVGTVETTGNITIDYTGKYCDEGLRELAEAANTEYWFDGRTVNLCKCERGTALQLGYDDGLISLERDVADNAKFYTRLYPVGSSRNINPETYEHTRLQLPDGQKYVDLDVAKYGVIDHYEQEAFSGIYPRYTGTVSGVRVEDRTDEDGTEFKVFFFSDASLPFDPNSYLLPNEKMRVSFQTGDLQGLGDTDDHYFEADYNSTTGEFEIINIWTEGEQLPRPGLSPAVGDQYIPWNISMPASYISLAEQEFAAAVNTYNQEHFKDISVYRGTTDHVWIEADPAQDKPEVDVFIGRRVRLVSSQYFPGTGYRDSRIVKITRRLDLPSQMELEISDAVSTGTLTKISDDIRGVWEFAKGLEVDGDDRWLSKRRNDTAQGFIRFIRGLQVGERFVTGLLGEGGVFRKEADGTTYLETDKLYIRMKAYFDTVEIRKYLHSGGNRIASVAGVKCVRVEWLDSTGDVLEQTDGNLSSVAKFRCYFRGSDGESLVTNDFLEGDLAYCHITNAESSSSLYQHHFWRLVVGKSTETNDDGEHYIDLSNANNGGRPVMVSFSYEGQGGTTRTMSALSFQAGSDIPVPQDDIIQLGSVNFQDRRGAIIEFVSGADAPSYQIFQDLGSDATNPYSLTGKNYVRFGYDSASGGAQVYIGNPDGSTYLWYHRVNNTPQLDIKANVTFTSPEQTYGTNDLNDFIDAVTRDVSNIHSQIDGEIDTWFYDYSPVTVDEHGAPTSTTPLNVAPYSEWDTEAKKEAHLGDIFYNTATGYAFRFEGSGQTGSRTYSWGEIQDSAVITALENAKDAYDLADNKRRVFVAQPTPPYEEGDLWANATHPNDYTGDTDASQNKYHNDLLRCNTSRSSGSFAITDWELASKYTDDTELRNFLGDYEGTAEDLKQQIDKKAETWYQDEDPSLDWYVVNPQTHEVITDIRSEHVGDLWYCTAPVSATPPSYYDAVHGGNKTWQYKYNQSTDNYYWAYQNVPVSVFDRIDGKAQLFVQKPNTANPNDDGYCYRKDDMWILESDNIHSPEKAGELMVATQSSTSYNSSHWVKKLKYTDDSAFNGYINAILNGTGASGDAATVAAAQKAIKDALGGATVVDGGLLLTSLIAMRKYKGTGSKEDVANYNTWGGISGLYKDNETGTGWKGHGIAAWYGGAMVDKECISPAPSESSWSTYKWARTLFRFDGSGYVANGNISWDASGTPSIKGDVIDAETLTIGGQGLDTKYVTLTTEQTITGLKTFGSKIKIGDIYIGQDSSGNLEVYKLSGSTHIAANLYATGAVSAFGPGTSGGGGVSLSHPLDAINTASPGNATSDGQALVYNGSAWKYSNAAGTNLRVGGILSVTGGISTGGTVSGTMFSGAGFSVSNKDDTYVLLAGGGTALLSDIGGGSYLPLSGGTMTGAIGASTASNSYNTARGVNFGDVAHIGAGSSVFSLFATGSIYIRPNSTLNASGQSNGIVLSSSTFTYNGYTVYHSGNLTPSDYALASSVYSKTEADDKFLYSSRRDSFTPNGTGWYRIGYVGRTGMFDFNIWLTNSYGQGHYKFAGSSYASSSWRIVELYGQYSSSYIPKIRLVYNSSDTRVYIEVYYGYSSANRDVSFKFFYGNQSDTVTKTADTPADTNESVIKEFTGSSSSDGRVITDTELTTTLGDYLDISTSRTANYVFASPNGSTGVPSFRKLVAYDIDLNNGTGDVTDDTEFLTSYAGTDGFNNSTYQGYVYRRAASKTWNYIKAKITADTTLNVASATKLQTSRSLWGQNFNGTADVNGELNITGRGFYRNGIRIHDYSNVSSVWLRAVNNSGYDAGMIGITGDATGLRFRLPASSSGTSESDCMNILYGGNVGIGTTSPTSKLHVDGTFNATGNSTIGGTLEVTDNTTLSGYLYMANNKSIYMKDSGGTNRSVMYIVTSSDVNLLRIGYGLRSQASSTYIYGGTSGMKFFTNGTTSRMIITASGLVGIGSTDETDFITEKLSVKGNIRTNDSDGAYIQIGGARIVWDNTNKALKVIQSDNLTAANLYATGAVSSFGIGSSASGLSLCTPLNNINTNILSNPTVNGATFVWNGNSSKFVYSNTSGQTLNAYNISVSSAFSAYTGRFGSTLEAVNMTVTGGDLTVQTGSLTVSSGTATIGNLSITKTSSSGQINFVTNNKAFYLNVGTASNPVTTKSWTTSSDIRLKNIVSNADASIEQIADAPIFNFKWKAGGSDVMLGTSAQYWQTIFPCAVKDAQNGYLAQDYPATALAAAVITARKVVDHEQRIRQLEIENEELKKELKQLKAA